MILLNIWNQIGTGPFDAALVWFGSCFIIDWEKKKRKRTFEEEEQKVEISISEIHTTMVAKHNCRRHAVVVDLRVKVGI